MGNFSALLHCSSARFPSLRIKLARRFAPVTGQRKQTVFFFFLCQEFSMNVGFDVHVASKARGWSRVSMHVRFAQWIQKVTYVFDSSHMVPVASVVHRLWFLKVLASTSFLLWFWFCERDQYNVLVVWLSSLIIFLFFFCFRLSVFFCFNKLTNTSDR